MSNIERRASREAQDWPGMTELEANTHGDTLLAPLLTRFVLVLVVVLVLDSCYAGCWSIGVLE